MCSAQIRDGLLTCVRDHDDAGHVFHASWAADRHDASEANEE